MKKVFSMRILIVLLIFLVSCRGKIVNSIKQTSQTESSIISADTVISNMEDFIMNITASNTIFTATLEDNSSAEAFKELLLKGSLTIHMSDYANMGKVDSIKTSLPANNEYITTKDDFLEAFGNGDVTITLSVDFAV